MQLAYFLVRSVVTGLIVEITTWIESVMQVPWTIDFGNITCDWKIVSWKGRLASHCFRQGIQRCYSLQSPLIQTSSHTEMVHGPSQLHCLCRRTRRIEYLWRSPCRFRFQGRMASLTNKVEVTRAAGSASLPKSSDQTSCYQSNPEHAPRVPWRASLTSQPKIPHLYLACLLAKSSSSSGWNFRIVRITVARKMACFHSSVLRNLTV